VFYEWPYLYDGSLAYEREYLAEFIRVVEAVMIVARAGDRPIGMATASPLRSQSGAVKAPLLRAGLDERETFYFGESVLLPAYRGKGLGHAFFDEREKAARAAGARVCTFCAVERAADHPLRPPDVRDLAAFWRKRGYERLSGVTMELRWQDRDIPRETDHLMQFWSKTLDK
jgi:GNAT superfamily N-acetyltransferase